MQEPAELGPPSAAVKTAVFSAPVLILISLALLGLTRYQVDPGGGIFAIVAALTCTLHISKRNFLKYLLCDLRFSKASIASLTIGSKDI